MTAAAARTKMPGTAFWILVAFLTIVACTGGSSRVDVQSLIILRPASVVMCAAALLTLQPRHLKGRAWLLWGIGALFALSLAHLIPLPPGLWQSLPGRQELAEVDQLAGLGPLWRPLTLTPMNGWHALSALFAPLAILMLGLQLNRVDLYRLLPVLIVLGVLSGLLGLLQVVGSPTGPLYFYSITTNGSAVGLFANRNHSALFLAMLFPMLTLWALTGDKDPRKLRARLLAAGAIGVVLVPLILVTGSRLGIITSIIGLVASVLLYGRGAAGTAKKRSPATPSRYRTMGLVAAGIALLALLTIYFSRAEAVQRLFGQSLDKENRLVFWQISADLFWKYFPIGSGAGSFPEAYQIIEPGFILNPRYLNHAHNDYLETAITFGLPGILLMLAALLLYLRRAAILWFLRDGKSRSVKMARMASVAIFMIAIASFSDYVLRIPFITCIFVIFALWLAESGRQIDVPHGAAAEGER